MIINIKNLCFDTNIKDEKECLKTSKVFICLDYRYELFVEAI